MKTIMKDGHTFLVFRTLEGGYHVFAEADARKVARENFGKTEGNTRAMWKSIWNEEQD